MFLAAAAISFLAQLPPEQTVQPHTYVSPSGEWSLLVDPSNRYGYGAAMLTVSIQGKAQWSGEVPFTFRDAVIGDAGVFAGFSYELGAKRGDGKLAVHVMDAYGSSLLADLLADRTKTDSYGDPWPYATRIVLLPARNVAIVCVPGLDPERKSEAWCPYALSPVKKLDVVHANRPTGSPEERAFTWAFAPVRGTSLTLAQWNLDAAEKVARGCEFLLYDEAWKPVWSLSLPGDFGETEDFMQAAQWDRRYGGGILSSSADQRFEVHNFAKDERVTYEVAQDVKAATGWGVREIARLPFNAFASPPEISKLELTSAGIVALDVDLLDISNPIRNIEAFTFSRPDQITFLRSEKHDALVTIDAQGKVVRELIVPEIKNSADTWRTWTPLIHGDWMTTVGNFSEDPPITQAWRLSVKTEKLVPLSPIKDLTIDRTAATHDGGYVILGSRYSTAAETSAIVRCTAEGTQSWLLEGSANCDQPSAICSPEDIAIDTDDSLLVLDEDRECIQVFDVHGKYVKAYNLGKRPENEYRSLCDLLVEPDGTFLVLELGNSLLRWHRITRDGTELSSFTVRRENGDRDVGDIMRKPVVDPLGRMWGTDRYQLLQYDAEGVVHGRFGVAPDPQKLHGISWPYFDGTGRLAIEDSDTHAIHFFTADGQRAFVCVPAPNDVGSSPRLLGVVAGPVGNIYVNWGQPTNCQVFDAKCQRRGPVESRGQCFALNPQTKGLWSAGSDLSDSHSLRRLDPLGGAILGTNRRPDRNFFEQPIALACSSDGTVVVLDTPGELCFFDENCAPLRQIHLPKADLGYVNNFHVGQRWAVISCAQSADDSSALVVSLLDGKTLRFSPPLEKEPRGAWSFGLSPDESELWALATSPAALHRFKLPR